jgi:TRAP-type mannitol/chloroaromatic compound transport system permease large subunit
MLPGLVLVGLYFLYQIAVAILSPSSSPPMARDEEDAVGAGQILRVLAPPILLIFAVLGSILGGIATPTEAAAVGAVGALLLAGERFDDARPWPQLAAFVGVVGALAMTRLFDLRLTREVIEPGDRIGMILAGFFCLLIAWGIASSIWRAMRERDPASGIPVLTDVMRATTKVTCMVFVILIGAQLFNLTFRGLGGEETVHEVLTALPGGHWGAMLAVMLVMFVLGFFLDFLEIVFVVVPIMAPVLFSFSNPDGSVLFHPVWVAVMIGINLQTSFLTPPFGFALFYLRGVAPPEVRTLDIYKGVFPFVLIQILMLGILAAFPVLATWLPGVVFG